MNQLDCNTIINTTLGFKGRVTLKILTVWPLVTSGSVEG